MKVWTKDAAIDALVEQANQMNGLTNSYPFSGEHTRWLANVLRLLEQVFGKNSRYYLTLAKMSWRFRGTSVVTTHELLAARHPDDIMRSRDQEAFLEQLESAHGLLAAAVDDLEQAEDIASVYEGKNTAPEASSILKVINLAEHKLRKVIHEEPQREKQVQDAFETLLVATDIPYTREKVSFEYSSRSYRPDFVIETIDLAIELKICPTGERERDIVKEINDDLLAYKTKFANILFIIYDLGNIRDIDHFTEAFEKHDNVVVRVVKH